MLLSHTNNVRAQMQAYAGSVQQKVRTAAKANIRRHSSKTLAPVTVQKDQQFKLNHLVAIGASAGGAKLSKVIARLPENFPAVVVPTPVFSQSFAIRMNICAMQVHEASDEQVIERAIYRAGWRAHMVQLAAGR